MGMNIETGHYTFCGTVRLNRSQAGQDLDKVIPFHGSIEVTHPKKKPKDVCTYIPRCM